MKLALISDIHGNFEALNAVLNDIESVKVDQIYCLGDIVGYGPNPCECLDKVMTICQKVVMGNHDQAALFDPDGFNPIALRAIYWTRDQLDSKGQRANVNKRWDFLSELPTFFEEEDVLFVHGSPRDPTNEYVFPETIYDSSKMKHLFSRVNRICFQGHTHMPGVFTVDQEFIEPADCSGVFKFGSEKFMINVGSVGQPRDENWRACYTVFDSQANTIEFRRVEYDFEKTIEKIYREEELNNTLGDRLRTGR